jgi:hypothetical protein
MKTVLLLAWLGLLLLPLRAEDWTTTEGQTYHNVQVLSHDNAYVTILHEDGGGRIPLSTLSPALQKRFDYDPAKAAQQIAATAAADQRDRAALAQEKVKSDAQEAQRQKEAAAELTAALFSPPPDADIPANHTPNSPPPDASDDAPAIASEPPTEIDDWGYGDFGYGYGYGGFGHRGYRGGGWNTAHVTHGASHGTAAGVRSSEAARH